GLNTGLFLPADQQSDMEKLADEYYRKRFLMTEGHALTQMSKEQRAEYGGQMGEGHDAEHKLQGDKQERCHTNLAAHYDLCSVERLPAVINVRQTLYQAQKLMEDQFDLLVLTKYEAALGDWQNVLLEHPAFRELEEIQTETYETQWKYIYKKQQVQKE